MWLSYHRFHKSESPFQGFSEMVAFLQRVFAIALVFAEVTNSHATTFCEQEIFLLFKSKGKTCTFWLGENVFGECQYSHIIQILISQHVITTFLKLEKVNDWEKIKQGLSSFSQEQPIQLTNEKGVFFIDYPGKNVIEPKRNDELAELFREHISNGGSNGKSWNEHMGIDGICLPQCNGLQAKLVYFYPAGLYVNYRISKVYHFKSSRYLLILTTNPMTANGFDTMHGFLILDIDE